MTYKTKRIFCLLNALMLTGSLVWTSAASLPLKDRVQTSDQHAEADDNLYQERTSYLEIQKEYTQKGYTSAVSEPIVLSPEDATVPEGEVLPLKKGYDGIETAVLFWEKQSWIEWTFTVPSEGLYAFDLTYHAIDDNVNDFVRSLSLDGKVPFAEADELRFYRRWKDAYAPKTNNLGNEVKPQQTQISCWITTPIFDSQGADAQELNFYLTPGQHTVRMTYIDGAMAISEMIVRPIQTQPTYEEYQKEIAQYQNASVAEPIMVQAESAVVWKNQQTLQRQHDSDPATIPQAAEKKLNILGGANWNVGGQAATWTFEVPADGLYQIGLRVKQSYGDGLPSHRKIAIDGEVPFVELNTYAFEYSRDWYVETLSDNQGNPYLFYLTAGEQHTITITAQQGVQGEAASELESIVSDLLELTRQIRLITGSDPDVNYDYQLPQKMPDLLQQMSTAAEQLQNISNKLIRISSGNPSAVSEIRMVSDQLNSLVSQPDTIARRLQELSDSLSTLSTSSAGLREQALGIDYFLFGAPGQSFPAGTSSIWQKLWFSIRDFCRSFLLDYDNIGSVGESEKYPVITVWVSRGQEWAEVMKQLIDDQFTPQYHINVQMNLLPASQLNAGAVSAVLLAVSSGTAPDVATSVAYNTPSEFAFRKAVVDLSQMPDYQEVSKRFFPQITIPYQYKGGVYALPETMNFRVLFYRKDILKSLGISIPNTWKDVYNSVLPVLTQNGMEFYYPKDPSVFLYQNGGDYYNEDQTLSAFDTTEGYLGIKEYTDLFTVYGVPYVANFFNRFRSGEMPIGIESTTTYLQLLSAAPELNGKWGVAMIPGHEKEDGSIDRSAAGLAGETAVIFSQSTKQQEAWQFLKWWTDTQTQLDFGRQVEAILGVAARWNSANIEAYQKSPWNQADLEVFLKQMEWLRDPPTLPGNYMTSRHLENMWNRIVLQKVLVRDSIEQAAYDINKELVSKAKEFS